MKFDYKIIEREVLENISEGIIVIDDDERIQLINRKAKEIFGIVYDQEIGHESGKIKKGDIVVIAENSFGIDDGGMDGEDLKLLGIHENIPKNSAFIYVGMYKVGGEYSYVCENKDETFCIEKDMYGKKIDVCIDFIRKNINIKIDNVEFPYSFVKAIGHMVIMDDNDKIKFCQSKGYSVRKEDIKSILNGSLFMKKIPETEMEVSVTGEKVTEILGVSESIRMLTLAIKSKSINYKGKYDEINGWPVKCSVHTLILEDRKNWAFLQVEDLSELNKIAKEKEEILRKLNDAREMVHDPFNVFIGTSEAMNKIKLYSKKIASNSSTVLITGESGTGKSLLAKAIHDYSDRQDEKFVEINCGSLSENLLESELFGYLEGAFTGARKNGKKGLIEYAHKGTAFLDEISEIPLSLQVKLLHVIQNKKIIPVGGVEPIEVDVRFICAANKDLEKMIEEKKFREDLYYRINVMQIRMPNLRERKDDLYSLVQYILHQICKKSNIQYKVLTNEAFNKLYTYNFPGNIRELENILERAISICDGDFIDDDSITLNSEKVYQTKTLKEILNEAERKAIINYMKKYNGDKKKVMKELNIKKTAFYEKLKKYNVD